MPSLFLGREVWYSDSMVPLRELNRTCAVRPAARRFPAQILCRLLGNRVEPCPLDPACRPCEKHGLWVLYASLGAGSAAAFCLLFWVLRLTRLSRLLGLLGAILLPPLRWGVESAVTTKRWYDSLFF